MTLKFKFFENDDLNSLESEVNNFSEQNKREITKDSIIKVHYNRTPIEDVLVKHDFTSERDEVIPIKKIANSVIIVWDKWERPTEQELAAADIVKQWEKDHVFTSEGKAFDEINTLEKYESKLDDSYMKNYEAFLEEQKVEQHKQVIILLTDMLIKKHGIRDVDKIMEKLKEWGVLTPKHLVDDGVINYQRTKYMVKSKIDNEVTNGHEEEV